MLLSSIAIMHPRILTPKAMSFRYNGMVRIGVFMGVMLFKIINPVKMLPTSNHLMEFISCGLFSLMLMYG
jgi:hypothetical protein